MIIARSRQSSRFSWWSILSWDCHSSLKRSSGETTEKRGHKITRRRTLAAQSLSPQVLAGPSSTTSDHGCIIAVQRGGDHRQYGHCGEVHTVRSTTRRPNRASRKSRLATNKRIFHQSHFVTAAAIREPGDVHIDSTQCSLKSPETHYRVTAGSRSTAASVALATEPITKFHQRNFLSCNFP